MLDGSFFHDLEGALIKFVTFCDVPKSNEIAIRGFHKKDGRKSKTRFRKRKIFVTIKIGKVEGRKRGIVFQKSQPDVNCRYNVNV